MTTIPGWFAFGNLSSSFTFAEISGGGYARQPIALTPLDQSRLSNQAPVGLNLMLTSGPASGWGAAVHGAIFNAATAGRMLLVFELVMPQIVTPGAVINYAQGAMTFTAPNLVGALNNQLQTTTFPAGTQIGTHGSAGFLPFYAGTNISITAGVLAAV